MDEKAFTTTQHITFLFSWISMKGLYDSDSVTRIVAMMAASRYIFMVIILKSVYSAYGQECSSTPGSVFSICEPVSLSGSDLFLNLSVQPEQNISFCKCAIEFTSSSRIFFTPERSSNVWCYYNLLTIQNGSDGSKTTGTYDCNQGTWSDVLFFRVKPTDGFQISLQKDEFIAPSSSELKACVRIQSNTSISIRCQDANEEIGTAVATTTSPKPSTTEQSTTDEATTSPEVTTESPTTEPTTQSSSLYTTSQLPLMTAKEEVTTTPAVTTPTPPLVLSTLDGIIIGAVVAAILFIFFINCIICLCKRRQRKKEAKERHRKMKNDEDINMPIPDTRYQSNPIFEDQNTTKDAKRINGFENPTFVKETSSPVKQVSTETENKAGIFNHAPENNSVHVTGGSVKGDHSENPHATATRDNSGMYTSTITNDELIEDVIEIPDSNLSRSEVVELPQDTVDTSLAIPESQKSL